MWKSSKIILFEDSMKVAWSDPMEAKEVEGKGSFYFHIAQSHTQVMYLLKPTHNFFTYTTVTFTCKFREENVKRWLHIAMNRNAHISFTTTHKKYVCGNTVYLIPRSHSRTVAVHKLYLTYWKKFWNFGTHYYIFKAILTKTACTIDCKAKTHAVQLLPSIFLCPGRNLNYKTVSSQWLLKPMQLSSSFLTAELSLPT